MDATSSTSGAERAIDRIYVGSLSGDHTEKRLLPDQTTAMFVPSNEGGMRRRGHLLFIRDGNLMAQRFDADRLELSDNPVVLAEQASVFSASLNGSSRIRVVKIP